jgi:hypothetical protein
MEHFNDLVEKAKSLKQSQIDMLAQLLKAHAEIANALAELGNMEPDKPKRGRPRKKKVADV